MEKLLASHDYKKTKKTLQRLYASFMLKTLKFTKSKLKYMKFSEPLIKRKSILMVNIFFLLKIRYKHARIKDWSN